MQIRLSYDRLISTIGFPTLVRWQCYTTSGPCDHYLSQRWCMSMRPLDHKDENEFKIGTLTPTIPHTKIGEPPYVAEAHCIADTGQKEFHRVTPVAPRCVLVTLQRAAIRAGVKLIRGLFRRQERHLRKKEYSQFNSYRTILVLGNIKT